MNKEIEKEDIVDDIKDTESQHNGTTVAIDKKPDVAARFLANLSQDIRDEPISEKEARRLLWKIDLIIIPILSLSVIISAVDKVIISNAAIYGMRDDLHLVGPEFSWVGSIFYFGFLIAEWPGNMLIQKLPIRTLYAVTVAGWAVMTFLTGATQNFGGIAADFSYGIGHSHSSIAPWRLLFIALGAITAAWAVIVYICLPSSPVEAWWLNDREKFICLERVSKSNTGIEDKTIKWYQIKECLLDPKSWLISIAACAMNIPNGALVTFSAIIVNGLGFTPLQTTLIGVPTGVVATIWSILVNVAASRLPGWRCALIFFAILFPMVAAICMWQLPRDNKVVLLGPYYAFYAYWAPYTMTTSLPMANTSGHTKKVTLSAMFFLGYCLGNILGPQVFRTEDAPLYHKGYIGLLASLAVGALSISVYGLLCKLENARRDKLQGGGPALQTEEEIRQEAFSDKTDKEKLNFRYSY